MKGIQLIDFDIAIKVQKDKFGKIISGLVVGDILHQNQALLLCMRKGELKENPSVGVGLADMLLSHDLTEIRNEIKKQLELDGQTVDKIILTPTKIGIEAHY